MPVGTQVREGWGNSKGYVGEKVLSAVGAHCPRKDPKAVGCSANRQQRAYPHSVARTPQPSCPSPGVSFSRDHGHLLPTQALCQMPGEGPGQVTLPTRGSSPGSLTAEASAKGKAWLPLGGAGVAPVGVGRGDVVVSPQGTRVLWACQERGPWSPSSPARLQPCPGLSPRQKPFSTSHGHLG